MLDFKGESGAIRDFSHGFRMKPMIALLHIVRVIVGVFCALYIFHLVAWLGAVLLIPQLAGYPITIRHLASLSVLIVLAFLSGRLFVEIGCVISRLHLKRHEATHSTLPENPSAASSKVSAAGRPETGAPPGSVGRARGLKRGLARSSLALLIGIGLTDVALHGFAPTGVACGRGFGARHQALQREAVTHMFSEVLPANFEFSEVLPANFEIEDFRCIGFQETHVDFKLRLPIPQGQALGATLDRAFESGSSNPRFTIEREVTRATQPDRTVTKFRLTGVGGVGPAEVREIELHLPTDPSWPSTVLFSRD